MAELDSLQEEPYKDSSFIMQLLRDNLAVSSTLYRCADHYSYYCAHSYGLPVLNREVEMNLKNLIMMNPNRTL